MNNCSFVFSFSDLTDVQITFNYYQFIFDLDMSIFFLSIIRAYIYLFYYDFKKNFRKFQWLYFLKLESEKSLIEECFFLKKEAKRYLVLIKFFIKAVKINLFLYSSGNIFLILRLSISAYFEIPFKWLVFSTIPNGFGYLFVSIFDYYLYNYFILIYFANCMFICKSLKSLSNHYSVHELKELEKDKLNSLARLNLKQFNRLIAIFENGQANFNYTFSIGTGVIVICFTFPYLLLFTDLSLISFLVTLTLHFQGIIIAIWVLIKINCNLIEEVNFRQLFVLNLNFRF